MCSCTFLPSSCVRECEEYEKALSDLSEVLRLQPRNREASLFAVRIREELRVSQSGNNNDDDAVKKCPVGEGEEFSFVDDVNAEN